MQNNHKSKEQKAAARLPVITVTEQYHPKETHWQLLIIGNPNYRGLQCLLKLLIITANNYSMPDLPLEQLHTQSVSDSFLQSVNQALWQSVKYSGENLQAQGSACTICSLSRNQDSPDEDLQSPTVQLEAQASDF